MMKIAVVSIVSSMVAVCTCVVTIAKGPEIKAQPIKPVVATIEENILESEEHKALLVAEPAFAERRGAESEVVEIKSELEASEPAETKPILSDKDFELLANVVAAEASNQGTYGMELVATVILNRVESEEFPNTVEGVVTDTKNSIQFASVHDGGIYRLPATDESREACKLALKDRPNHEILYFRTDHYHKFGERVFSYRDHYFSK